MFYGLIKSKYIRCVIMLCYIMFYFGLKATVEVEFTQILRKLHPLIFH